MGFLKKIKKAVKKVAKLAIKTAPIWSNFVLPGSGLALGAVKGAGMFGKFAGAAGKIAKVAKVVKPALTAAKRLQALKTAPKGPPTYPSSWARQSVQQSPNGTRGRMGTLHARAIARMRATRPAPKGTRAGYLRAQRIQHRPMTGMGRRRLATRLG